MKKTKMLKKIMNLKSFDKGKMYFWKIFNGIYPKNNSKRFKFLGLAISTKSM